LTVQADLERAIQALRALITNAIRFSADGSPVRVEVSAGADLVSFVVHDRGPGIASEDRERVFDRLWHQPDAGPGLGLYLARGLARAMDGDVTLAERPGGGSSVSFSLRRDG